VTQSYIFGACSRSQQFIAAPATRQTGLLSGILPMRLHTGAVNFSGATMKCRRCLIEDPPCGFSRSKYIRNDRICRICDNLLHKEAQSLNPELARTRWRKWYRKNQAEESARLRELQYANVTKENARKATRYAIQTGRIKRGPCEVCGDKKVDAHHDDYSNPLEVRWLCRVHHMQHHHRQSTINKPVTASNEA
jgi:hypothetical protein